MFGFYKFLYIILYIVVMNVSNRLKNLFTVNNTDQDIKIDKSKLNPDELASIEVISSIKKPKSFGSKENNELNSVINMTNSLGNQHSEQLINLAHNSSSILTAALGVGAVGAAFTFPPLGILIAAITILVIKGIDTYEANVELRKIYEEILEILKFIEENFDLNAENKHIERLKEHLYNILKLCITVNKIFKWRYSVFPYSIINSFIKELTLINSELIIDIKLESSSSSTHITNPINTGGGDPTNPTNSTNSTNPTNSTNSTIDPTLEKAIKDSNMDTDTKKDVKDILNTVTNTNPNAVSDAMEIIDGIGEKIDVAINKVPLKKDDPSLNTDNNQLTGGKRKSIKSRKFRKRRKFMKSRKFRKERKFMKFINI